ncbi:AAA family ATPase [Streptococcus rifensis]
MARYKIGTSSDTWTFNRAYEIAQDGDSLVFDDDFSLNIPVDIDFVIDKNIKLIGGNSMDKYGKSKNKIYLEGRLTIDNESDVTIERLHLITNRNQSLINVINKSQLTINSSQYANNQTENNNLDDRMYIRVSDQSALHLNNVDIYNGHAGYLYCQNNSIININDSDIKMCRLLINLSSTLNITNSEITTNYLNGINGSNHSKIFIADSEIFNQNYDSRKYSAIGINNSFISTKCVTVYQQDESYGIILADRSKIISTGTETSLMLQESVGFLNNDNISQLSVESESYVNAKGELTCYYGPEEYTDIMIKENSTLIAEDIRIINAKTPNFKIHDNSFFYYNSILCYQEIIEDELFDVSPDSQVIYGEENYASDQQEKIDNNEKIRNDEGTEFEEFDNLIGLSSVKRQIEDMINQVKANNLRVSKGLKPKQQILNSVFMGNPGTGKTTVARMLGKLLFENGVLSGEEFKFIEVSESDLISQNVGGTAIQTKSFLDQARGGILFVDEAYTLNKSGSVNFGQEAINTIMKYMEDYRDEIMIIFAGYTKEMEEFLRTNPGLVSRLPNRFIFEDFSSDEIVQLGKQLFYNDQFKLEDEDYYSKQVAKSYSRSLDKSNGRWIRNFNDELIKSKLSRAVKLKDADVETISNIDIDIVLNQGEFKNNEGDSAKDDSMERLNDLIGINNVKRQVQEFIYQVEANQKKESIGMRVSDFTLHSLFLGNPGTGKTTVARIIGEVLYQKGIISQKKFIEVSRSDLVAGYVGQTAIKTREVLESALGGVLFIDEAYTLGSSGGNDFGKEAIEEILKFMEDHRRDIVIVFAGYTKEMDEFLQINSGLKSRIPTVFNFEDYTPDEIVQIGLMGLEGYKLNESLYRQMVIDSYSRSDDNSNGRWIRNINEKLLRIQSARLIEFEEADYDVISDNDIIKTLEG